MSLPSISYSDVATLVHKYINKNCTNVGSGTENVPARNAKVFFAGTNAALKGSWYTYTRANTPTHVAKLTETPSLTDGHFGQFLKDKCSVTNLSTKVNKGNFINLLRDIALFCSARLYWFSDFSATPSGTNPTHNVTYYLIYKTSTYPTAIALNSTNDFKLVTADDVNQIVNIIKLNIAGIKLDANNNFVSSGRCDNARYTITFQEQ